MYFTLGISAASRDACAALVRAARETDPRVMPIPGPAQVAWSDERTAILHWGAGGSGASQAGTIWADHGLRARTGLARIDPVYLAEAPGAVVVSDRAGWAAAVTGRLEDYDPVLVGALVCLGFPTGAATAFRGVRALGGDRALRVSGGRATQEQGAAEGDPGRVAAALVDAVRPLARETVPVELSLTGGKDSRLIAAALAVAEVPFRARTHGSARHPDVVIAGLIAERLGVKHTVTEPRAAAGTPDRADVAGRIRSAVLVCDGMLSAFENVGSGVGADGPVQIGGHGGELLRGGYAQGRGVAAAERFRRLTTRRLSLLRPAAAAAYVGSLAPWAAALAAGPLRALDDFYLANRAGRWSAAARQAYLIRSPLMQPFFSDQVIRAARAVPLAQRINGQLHRDVLAALRPDLLGLPLAGRPPPGQDWRRSAATIGLLREYILGQDQLFDLVSRRAAERVRDPQAAWALASLAALLSGDWRGQPRPYLASARQK